MSNDGPAIEWAASAGLIPYRDAVAAMEQRAAAIADAQAPELIWLLEHPACYTAGTSAKPAHLLAADRFPVYETGRGGQLTYHGPGQQVIYVMLDVRRRAAGDVRVFVAKLERWIITTLSHSGVIGESRPGRVGIWVIHTIDLADRESKIAAIGLRIRRGISFHGLSLNVAPDLEHFSGIVPCGIAEHGVTSLAALGADTSMAQVGMALRRAFEREFGRTDDAPPPILGKVCGTGPLAA